MVNVRSLINSYEHQLCGHLPVAGPAGLLGACLLCVRPAPSAGLLLGIHQWSQTNFHMIPVYLNTRTERP